MEDKKSFRGFNSLGSILFIALFILFIVGIFFSIYYFSLAGLFNIFDIEYQSNTSLVIFVGCFILFSSLVELFFKALFEHLFNNLTTNKQIQLLHIISDFIANSIVLFTIDEFMNSISIPLEIEMLIAFFIAAFEAVLVNSEKTNLKSDSWKYSLMLRKATIFPEKGGFSILNLKNLSYSSLFSLSLLAFWFWFCCFFPSWVLLFLCLLLPITLTSVVSLSKDFSFIH